MQVQCRGATNKWHTPTFSNSFEGSFQRHMSFSNIKVNTYIESEIQKGRKTKIHPRFYEYAECMLSWMVSVLYPLSKLSLKTFFWNSWYSTFYRWRIPVKVMLFLNCRMKNWLHTEVYNFHYIELPPWEVWRVEIGLERDTFRMESAAFAVYFFLFIALLYYQGKFPHQHL